MNKSVHAKGSRGPHDVTGFLKKLWKHRRVVVRVALLLEWVISRVFHGN